MAIPPGYRFNPTEEELVTHYLRPMVLSNNPPFRPSWIAEKELYGKNANPWDVFSDRDPWTKETSTKTVKESVYVFTKLTKIGPKRFSRTAGCGLWDGQTGFTTVKDSCGEEIGYERMLNFSVKEKGVDRDETTKLHGHWIMHEYGVEDDDHVICKITRIWKQGKYSIKKRQERDHQEDDAIYTPMKKRCQIMMNNAVLDEDHMNSLGRKETSVINNSDDGVNILGTEETVNDINSEEEVLALEDMEFAAGLELELVGEEDHISANARPPAVNSDDYDVGVPLEAVVTQSPPTASASGDGIFLSELSGFGFDDDEFLQQLLEGDYVEPPRTLDDAFFLQQTHGDQLFTY